MNQNFKITLLVLLGIASIFSSVQSVEITLFGQTFNSSTTTNINITSSLTEKSERIPSQIGLFSLLTHFEISNVKAFDPIPLQLSQLSQLQTLVLTKNEVNGTIPSEFGLLSDVTLINFESTFLSGGIPSEIASLMKLETLIVNNTLLTLPNGEDGKKICDIKSFECFNSWITSGDCSKCDGSMSASFSSSSTHTASQTSSSSQTGSSSQTASQTASQTGSQTASQTASSSQTDSQTPSQTGSPSTTDSQTASTSQTPSQTGSQTASSSHTPSSSQTSSQTGSSSHTPSQTASTSQTSSHTPSSSQSSSQTSSISHTASQTASISDTPSQTSSISHTPSETGSSSHTPSQTSSSSHTPSQTASSSQTASQTASSTQTASQTASVSQTSSQTASSSHTPSQTVSSSQTASQTASSSQTVSPSQTQQSPSSTPSKSPDYVVILTVKFTSISELDRTNDEGLKTAIATAGGVEKSNCQIISNTRPKKSIRIKANDELGATIVFSLVGSSKSDLDTISTKLTQENVQKQLNAQFPDGGVSVASISSQKESKSGGSDDSFPGWAIALIVILSLLFIGLAVFIVIKRKKSQGGDNKRSLIKE